MKTKLTVSLSLYFLPGAFHWMVFKDELGGDRYTRRSKN